MPKIGLTKADRRLNCDGCCEAATGPGGAEDLGEAADAFLQDRLAAGTGADDPRQLRVHAVLRCSPGRFPAKATGPRAHLRRQDNPG